MSGPGSGPGSGPVPAADRGEAGFTLLEVLVAFTIAALALAVLFHAAVDAVGAERAAARYTEALVRARSHLSSIPVPPKPGDSEGDEGDGFHWHLRVTTERHEMTRQNVPVTLFGEAISMSWTEGDRKRVVELRTQRAAIVATE